MTLNVRPMLALLAVTALSGCSTPVNPEAIATVLKAKAGVADATCITGAEDRTVDSVITYVQTPQGTGAWGDDPPLSYREGRRL